MCYILYLSTDSRKDLTTYNTELVQLNAIHGNDENQYTVRLKNPNKWHVGSKSGCSCTFRYTSSPELGFGGPEPWYREGEDEIKATGELFRMINDLANQGNSTDCICIWEGTNPEEITEKEVDLSLLNKFTLRLFENHHFVFRSSGTSEK